MTKEEYQKELKNIRNLYIVGIKKGTNPLWDKGVWRKYRVFYLKKNTLNLFYPECKKDCPLYWDPKAGIFNCRALGTSRVFEIVYNIGRWLYQDGYRFKDNFLSWE